MDTRFAAAIHCLILISEADVPMSSEEMAGSVGANPSYIRKVLGMLRRGGLIESRQGVAGFQLLRPTREITLLQAYQAIYGTDGVELFDIHRNPNDRCIVGRYIRPTLTSAFAHISEESAQALADMTLADVIADMRKRAQEDGVL